MKHLIEQSFDDAAARLDIVRAELHLLGTLDVQGDPRVRAVVRSQKAGVYVWLAACIEAFVKGFLSRLIRDISQSNLNCNQIRVELIAVCAGATFSRIEELRKLKKWHERIAALRNAFDSCPATMQDQHLPLDGRTIEPYHLEIIWAVFALPRAPFQNPLQKLALLEIAENRNKVAHGSVQPEALGGAKTIPDMERLVRHVEDLVQHIYECGNEYLENSAFRR